MFCGSSAWNPVTRKHDSTESLFCGTAPASWDIRVDSLPDCPQNMTKAQLSNWQKKQKNKLINKYLINFCKYHNLFK